MSEDSIGCNISYDVPIALINLNVAEMNEVHNKQMTCKAIVLQGTL